MEASSPFEKGNWLTFCWHHLAGRDRAIEPGCRSGLNLLSASLVAVLAQIDNNIACMLHGTNFYFGAIAVVRV
jgi:hypothetical protein